jgi:Domain of unknown function (DUF4375)
MKPLIQFRVRWAAGDREHISEFPAASASEARRAMEAYELPAVRVVSVEPLGPAAPTAEAPGHPSVTGVRDVSDLPDYWNACVEVISRPVGTLDAIQRPAALVFEYYGRVMNGGHSSHFEAHGDSRDSELLQALKDIGAAGHARILAECYFLRHEAKRRPSEEDYASETIADLDRQFDLLEPAIPELLARYFKAHPECFPIS